MRKIILLISQTFFALTSVFTLASCKMASHQIEVNVINKGNAKFTIFDKAFRSDVVSATINDLAYTSPLNAKEKKTAWFKTNELLIRKLDPVLAKSFYEDLNTKNQDTYFTRFDISNSLENKELKINDVEVKVISEIKSLAATTADKKATIDFALNFKGITKTYTFLGNVDWYYKISEVTVNETKTLKFEWIYKADISNIEITKLS